MPWPLPLSRYAVLAAIIAALFVAAYYYIPKTPKPLLIRPEALIVEAGTKARVHGQFYIGPGYFESDQTILSLGTGGACIVADLNPVRIPAPAGGRPFSCSTDAQCTAALDADQRDKLGWVGYCHESKCWTRPGPQCGHGAYCVISAFDNDNEPWARSLLHDTVMVDAPKYVPKDYRNFNTSDAYVLAGAGNTDLDWRLVACLNGYDPATKADSIHCAMERFGPVAAAVPHP